MNLDISVRLTEFLLLKKRVLHYASIQFNGEIINMMKFEDNLKI